MPCSHCSGIGHNYRSCPSLTPLQKKKMIEDRKKKKAELLRKREEKIKEKIKEENERIYQIELNKQRDYIVKNNNMYEVVIYWGWGEKSELNDNIEIKRLLYIGPMEEKTIKCRRIHRIVIFPVLELIGQSSDAPYEIDNEQSDTTLFKVFDMDMFHYPDEEIILYSAYNPPKTDVDQWKEFGLKSHYLLKQIERLSDTGKKNEDGETIYHEKYDNITPFLSIIQDIPIPQNCTEADKEKAGIPSSLTNIT